MSDGVEYKPAAATLAVKCNYLSARTASPLWHLFSAPLKTNFRDSEHDPELKNSGLRAAIYRYITPIDVV